jgi:hypothetical protein
MSKKARILGITWNDLISREEQKLDPIDDLRRSLLDHLANPIDGFTNQIQMLFDCYKDHFWRSLTSDFCVILYRLLDQFPNEILKTYQIKVSNYPPDEISLLDFKSLVETAHIANKKLVPIVLGNIPGVNL